MLYAAIISLLIPSEPGGNYDLAGRVIARHLPNHLAGKPTIVVQNMPGAGGISAANHLYTIAARDGSVVGLVQGSAVQDQALGNPAVRFDASKFEWIGTPTRIGGVTVVWHTADMTKEVPFGASTTRHVAYARLSNQWLDTKFKVIRGYRSAVEIVPAMARGEVQAMNAFSWDQWLVSHPDWVREGKIRRYELTPPPQAKPLFMFLKGGDALGRALAAPPGVDIKELRAAFHDMMWDPAFLLDMRMIGFDTMAMPGGELAEQVRWLLTTPKQTIEAVNAVLKD